MGDLASVIENYYDDRIRMLNSEEQMKARRFIEEGLILDNRRLAIFEGVAKRNFDIDEALLHKLLDSGLLRTENTSLGLRIYEVSHDTLINPIQKSFERRIDEEKRRSAEQERRRS